MKRGDGFNEVYVMELNSKLITGNSKKNSKRRQVIVIRSTNEATSMAQLQNRFEKFYNIDSRAEPGRSLWLHAQQQIQRMSQTTPNVPLVL